MQNLNLNCNRVSRISALRGKNKSLNTLYVKGNNLDSGEAVQKNIEEIETLMHNGVEVVYHPQRESGDMYNTNLNFYVNGKEVVFISQKPYVDNSLDLAFVPVRSISEALGATLTWNQEQQKITITKEDKTITLVYCQH